jgi:DnaJ-domain-containing protein 1
MPTIFIGLIALILVLWLAKSFAKADPKYLIRVGRTAGGIVALASAAFLGVRGQLSVAVPLGLTGLGLLGYIPLGRSGFWTGDHKSAGQMSQVRSNFLTLELDHDTGAMTGEITAGRLAGTKLDTLELSTLVGLLGEFDVESRDLLAAYLDRRHPGWREDAQGDPAAGSGPPRSGKMTKEEAYQILGLEPGASADEIGRAHRGLMKKLHPDQGGSTYLAARVNEAKDVLLRRHR